MAPPDDKRIKFCRYCDGVIEWGTEVCPHCGEILKVTSVDDLDFVTGPSAGSPPPAAKPTSKAPPDDSAEEEPETIEFEALDVPAATQEMPVLKPLGEEPPVIKPLPAGPPVVKPIGTRGAPPGRKPPIRGRGRGGPPVVKPLAGGGDPPVLKPMPAGPAEAPVLTPIGGGAPAAPAAGPVPDCPLCGEPMELRGGACRTCGKVVCMPCQMRANGMRTGRVMEMNRVRWSDRSRKLGPDGIICPECGNKGVDLP